MSLGESRGLHGAGAIAETLRALNEYGPVRVVVLRADLPDIEGIGANPSAFPDLAREYAMIGSSVLSIRDKRGSLSLSVRVRDGDQINLPLDIVRRVEADHPYSGRMPLNGRVMGTIRVRNCGAMRVPGWATYSIERGMVDVVESGIHLDNPGVGLVRSYDASELDSPITVEAAKNVGAHCMTFLISRVGRDEISQQPYHIVTSCMGHSEGGTLSVLWPAGDSVPPKWVDMVDLPQGATDDELLSEHLERAGRYGTSLEALRQIVVDETVLYVAHS